MARFSPLKTQGGKGIASITVATPKNQPYIENIIYGNKHENLTLDDFFHNVFHFLTIIAF